MLNERPHPRCIHSTRPQYTYTFWCPRSRGAVLARRCSNVNGRSCALPARVAVAPRHVRGPSGGGSISDGATETPTGRLKSRPNNHTVTAGDKTNVRLDLSLVRPLAGKRFSSFRTHNLVHFRTFLARKAANCRPDAMILLGVLVLAELHRHLVLSYHNELA
jgi:hypothetical protein